MGLHFYKLEEEMDNGDCESIKSKYTFIVGFGFLPDNPIQREIQNIRRHSFFISLSLIFLMITSSLLQRHNTYFLRIFDILKNSIVNSIILIGITLLTFGIVFSFYNKIMQRDLMSQLRKKNDKVRFISILCYVVIFLGMTSINSITASLFTNILNFINIHPKEKIIIIPKTPIEIVFYIIAWCVIPAILEELFFRGALLGVLKKFGGMFALLTTSMLSAIFHGELIQFPGLFLSGFLLGCVTLHSNNLMVPIMMHSTSNVCLLLLNRFYTSKGKIILYIVMTLSIIATLILIIVSRKRDKMVTDLTLTNSQLSMKIKQRVFFTSNPMLMLMLIAFIQFISSVQLVF